VARFDGGTITSDGGRLLLAQVERLTGIIRQFAGCFRDYRDPGLIACPVEQLTSSPPWQSQRAYKATIAAESVRPDRPFRT